MAVDIREKIRSAAAKRHAKLVLPEGAEPRVIQAAATLISHEIACVVLLGDPAEILAVARKNHVDLSDVELLHPAKSPDLAEYAEEFYQLRKHKGLSSDDAHKAMADPLYYGAMMLHKGAVDGYVGGCINPTAHVVRACLHCLGTAPGIKTVSSCSVMVLPHSRYGVDGTLLFADTGVVPDPTAEQLADIAWSTAQSMRRFFNVEPFVAMISFSTKGSAKHEIIEKVIQATRIARERWPELMIDGEMQVDAALVPEVGRRKAPGSPVAGKANVLVFPDLNAANSAYKLTERLALAGAYGPILQGLTKPASDLSRGCSTEDIVDIAAFVILQAEAPCKD